MPQQQPPQTIAKIGPACYLAGTQMPPYPQKSYPVTNAQGKVAYFHIIPRDLLRHLGVIIKE